jgi:predicted nucleic acid-binding protein
VRKKLLLTAVDTNVLLDEEDKDADVLDALETLRERLPHAQFVITETVFQELAWIFEQGDTPLKRKLAEGTLTKLLERGYTPMNFSPLERGILAEISLKIRMKELVPHEEVGDSMVIAEAAWKSCEILLTSDAHILNANKDIGTLWKILKDSDAEKYQIVLSKPRTLVRKYRLKR